MFVKPTALFTSILLFFLVSCGEKAKKDVPESDNVVSEKDSIPKEKEKPLPESNQVEEEEAFVLTEENAIDFFFNYANELKNNKVRITTTMGSFTLQLYDNVPYHKANFIYLARKKYFDSTQFHRVVKDFIIQGGNSDDRRTARKRGEIGRYLLPPDAKKGYKHHRGTISMPSSERDNPHKLASPYEFFIVVTKPGSYHLDGS